MNEVLVEVNNLKKYFPIEQPFLASLFSKERKMVHAVNGIDFNIRRAEIFGLAGETGCGKTTTGKLILRAMEPTEGRIIFEGRELNTMDNKEFQKFRRSMQMIFQNPFASLNPRKTAGDIIGLPLEVQSIASGSEKEEITLKLLEKVGLKPPSEMINRYPHEFSGGQKQRIGIARALATNPKFIIADEPVASLDVSIQARILNLMRDLKQDLGLTYLMITHDLTVAKYMCERIAIMYVGKIVEMASSEELFNSPQHPYTKALLSEIPIPDPTINRERIKLMGEVPNSINLPSGCIFHPRCPFSTIRCEHEEPKLIGDEHSVACHLVDR